MPDDLTRATALASPLRDFPGWHLGIACLKCRELRPMAVSDLISSRGAETKLADIVARLRCHACRSPPYWVKLSDSLAGASGVRKIMLVGESGNRAARAADQRH